MNNNFKLEKKIWTESDFEKMSWHDNYVYAIYYSKENKELQLDIDYIFEWRKNKEGDKFYFLIAPCALVFEDVVISDFETNLFFGGMIISDIVKDNDNWQINDVSSSFIDFKSSGYKMYVKQKPVVSKEQKLDFNLRKEVNFETKTY